jgi:four helix bundle protein
MIEANHPEDDSQRYGSALQIRDSNSFGIGDMPAARYVPSGREKRFLGVLFLEKVTIREQAIQLTVEITGLCDSIKNRSVYTKQLMRSCSSIGANTHEARYAQSRADFINKMEIALKECYEAEYWLEILYRVHSLSETQYKSLMSKSGVIRKRIIASITTAKKNKTSA